MKHKTNKKVSLLGLHLWERKGRKPLWRVFIRGVMYTSSGDGTGQISERSAELAWIDIKAKVEAHQSAALDGVEIINDDFAADPMDGVEIILDDIPAAVRATPPTRTAPALTKSVSGNLMEEIDLYLAEKRTEYKTGQISVHALDSIRREAGNFRDWLLRTGVAEINERVCSGYRDFLLKMLDRGTKVSTLQRYLAAAKRVIRWLYDYGHIEKIPRNLNPVFSYVVPRNKRVRLPVKIFTIEQVRAIYSAAAEDTKLFILLSLNYGAYFSDIADLRHSQIAGGRFVRARTKTGEGGSWKMWEATARLLAKYATPAGKFPDGQGDSFVLRRADGSQLYGYDLNPATDRIRRCNRMVSKFEGILEKLKIDGCFKMLRKTGGSMIEQVSNKDTGKLFLANSKDSIADIHYFAANFKGLDEAMEKVEKLFAFE